MNLYRSLPLLLASYFILVAKVASQPPVGLPVEAPASNIQPVFTHINVRDGLPDRIIYSMEKDRDGFIWMATNLGLIRWDGHEYKQYNQFTGGLPFDRVKKIISGRKGELWLNPVDEQNRRLYGPWIAFDPVTGQFHKLKDEYPELAGPAQWLDFDFRAFSGGPSVIIGQNQLFYSETEQLPYQKWEQVAYCYASYDGALWLVRFVSEDEKVRIHLSRPGATGGTIGDWTLPEGIVLAPSWIPDVYVGPNGRHWCRRKYDGADEIGYFVPEPGYAHPEWHSVIRLPNDKRLITYKINPYNQTIWFLFDGQLAVWKLGKGWIYSVTGEGFPELLSRQENIWFFKDQPGEAWLTGGEGLFQVRLKVKEFKTYLDGEPGMYSTRGITTNEKGRIIVNGTAGLLDIDPKTGSFQRLIDHHPPLDPFIRQYGRSQRGGYVAYKDARGAIWAEAFGQLVAINRYPDVKPVSEWAGYDGGLSHTYVYFQNPYDTAYRVWAVGNAYLGLLYPDSQKVERFDRLNGFEEAYMGAEKHAVYPEDKGHFWICSRKGLFLCDVHKGLVEHYSTEGEGRFYLPHDIISHMHKDADGVYWLTSKGGGLIRWNRQTGEWKQFTVAEGLSNNVLYAVYEDSYGNLWLPSNYGLMAFNKATEKVQLFLPEDGLAHEEFNTWSHYRGADGRLCFGGLNGITTFHPDSLGFQAPLSNVSLRLTQVAIEDKKTGLFADRTMQFRQEERILVSPAERSVAVHASLMDFYKPGQHLYGFKIEGFDKEWNYQRNPQYRVTNLPYGHYTLKVKAKSAEGKWSAEELSIPLDFVRPFYATNWFILLCFLAGIGLFASLFLYRIRALKNRQLWLEQEVQSRTQTIQQQAEQLKELGHAKSRFFANVSHELRTPLTLILGPIGTLLKARNEDSQDHKVLKTVEQNSKRLLRLVNEILDLSKLESGKMEVEELPVHLYSLLYQLLETYGPAARHKQLRLSFQYSLKQEARFLLDAPKIELIANNLLSNALRFTPPQGRIEMAVRCQGPNLEVRVADTGRGIHPGDLPHIFERYFQSKQPGAPIEGGAGIGLAVSKEMAELLGGRLTVESELGRGSTFLFELPCKEVFGEQTPVSRREKGKAVQVIASPGQQEDETPAEAEASYTGPGRAFRNPPRPQVLVAEDHLELQLFLRGLLERHYTVSLASNGLEALEIMKERGSGISLILSDIMMPEMDGYALLEALKTSDAWRGIPVVMLTARAGREDELRALRLGVDDYMSKPFQEEELLACIETLLARRSQREEAVLEEVAEAGQKGPLTGVPATDLAISVEGQRWLEELEAITFSRIGDFNLNTESLAYDLGMSGRSLQRRLKSLTGLTPNEYLQEARLQKARELLESRECSTVKEATLSVGMRDIPYFSRQFKKRFGKAPSDLLQ
ncbi:MAG: response regulator [Phaeodactylibacter sp.]|nr:response regulator [Phaeodactylibacter sp.]